MQASADSAATGPMAGGPGGHRDAGVARTGRELCHREPVQPRDGHRRHGRHGRHGRRAAGTVGCRGVTPAVIPALGFITNPSRTQAGHLWWRPEAGGICIGTVIEWVQYNTTATKTWRVIVYSAQHPDGQVVAQRTFTLGQGWYWWSFGVHQVFSGLSAVCITADDSFGVPCLHFGT